jgi:hypothetical protein
VHTSVGRKSADSEDDSVTEASILGAEETGTAREEYQPSSVAEASRTRARSEYNDVSSEPLSEAKHRTRRLFQATNETSQEDYIGFDSPAAPLPPPPPRLFDSSLRPAQAAFPARNDVEIAAANVTVVNSEQELLSAVLEGVRSTAAMRDVELPRSAFCQHIRCEELV